MNTPSFLKHSSFASKTPHSPDIPPTSILPLLSVWFLFLSQTFRHCKALGLSLLTCSQTVSDLLYWSEQIKKFICRAWSQGVIMQETMASNLDKKRTGDEMLIVQGRWWWTTVIWRKVSGSEIFMMIKEWRSRVFPWQDSRMERRDTEAVSKKQRFIDACTRSADS